MNAPEKIDAPDRSRFIGGSDVAAVLGISPWMTPVQLWLQKTGQVDYSPDPARERRFARGKALEPIIIQMGIDKLKEMGHEVELLRMNQRYVHPEYPFLACEIDFELLCDGQEITGDAKSVHGFARKKWGDEQTDEMPIEYAAQFQHGMGIRGRDKCVVFALIGLDDVAIYWLDRDQETIDGMRERCVEFWERNIVGGERPDILTYDDASTLWAKDDGTSIEADDEVARKVAAYQVAKATAKQYEEKADALKLDIVEFMQPHATLTHGGAPIATWKTQTASRIDSKALRAAHPKLAQDFTTITESRVFRPKQGKS